ncbi:UDPGT domain-containing protein [Cephalotus follicularis]|uniref:UDPGT domain-containing protein n=1 Tax=Cephalotus follicularis TaxID=3775 RepID=A0A1Q3BBN7_CEPFO|nr:UDPGT domain-containing protein [Cephalotus follicularis]
MASFKQCHVMMFPWLAFGHMIPFLEFSKKLAANGIRISYISTPRNVQRLPAIPPNLADRIKFVEIPLPSVDGLPQHCGATIDLQQVQIQYLKKACDGLREPIEKLMQEDLPDWILFDFVQCWIPEIAAKLGVPCAFFSAYSAAALAFMGSPQELTSFKKRNKPEDFTMAPDWFPFPSLVAHRLDQAAIMFQNVRFPDISGMSSGDRLAKTFEGCDFVAVRSCREFEGAYLDILGQLYQKPVLPVGLLPPNSVGNRSHDSDSSNWSSTLKWLDEQEPKSVVFVGFGSEYKMPIEQVHELAHGVEHSGLPFIWTLREPEGVSCQDLLPSGFMSRISNKGLVYLGWAPQLEILAHFAIGGCLFHSGWGSIIESLGFGHPQILMPMVADQGLMSKLLVEKGIGIEEQRNEDGSFNREVVAKTMRLVMVEQEGRPLRQKAAQMQTIFANHDLHDSYIRKLIQYLDEYKKKEY